MKDLRIEARFRNNVLWHAIHDVYPSITAFCRAHGLNKLTVGDLLNLRCSPWRKRRRGWTETARRVSESVGIGPDELFPELLYETPALRTRRMAEVSSVQFVSLAEARNVPLLPDAEERLERERLQEAVGAILNTLTPREARVIRSRFGLDGEGEQTYEEVGAHEQVTRERIRQIEVKALRKLRQPWRLKLLEPTRDIEVGDSNSQNTKEDAELNAATEAELSASLRAFEIEKEAEYDARDHARLRARAEQKDPELTSRAIAICALVPDDALQAIRMSRRQLHRDVYEAILGQDHSNVVRFFGERASGEELVDHINSLAGVWYRQ